MATKKKPSPPKEPKPRRYPSEDLADDRPKADLGGLSPAQVAAQTNVPAMVDGELADLVRAVETATPEQFQQELAKVFRRMMVRGLREIPPPRSIKELQAIYDMFRKAEGIERADRGGGPVSMGFLPRVVGRRAVGAPTVVEFPPEQVETVVAEPSGDGVEEFEV